MQPHKIVAQIILLVISVINFALAAPVLVRGIREARVDVVDVAEDVTTALRKRWIPSDRWSTNAADGANTPPSLASSDSFGDYRLDMDLRPPDPESPIALDSTDSTRYSSLGSIDWDYSHPLGPPPPDWDQPDPLGSPSPAHKNLPLDIDSHASPHSSPGLTDDQPPPAPPSDPGPSTWAHPPSGPGPSTWAHPPSGPGPSTWAHLPSDSESSAWPDPPSDSGASSWPHTPSDSGSSTWLDPPSDSGASSRPHTPSDSGSSTWPDPPSDPGPSTPHPPPSPGPSTRPYLPSDPRPSTWAYATSDTTPPLPGSGPLQHESESFLSELLRGRFKRRISAA